MGKHTYPLVRVQSQLAKLITPEPSRLPECLNQLLFSWFASGVLPKLDAIAKLQGISRSDALEMAVDAMFKKTVASTTEEDLERLGLIE